MSYLRNIVVLIFKALASPFFRSLSVFMLYTLFVSIGLVPIFEIDECGELLKRNADVTHNSNSCTVVLRLALVDRFQYISVYVYFFYFLFFCILIYITFFCLRIIEREIYIFPLFVFSLVIFFDLYLLVFSLKVADPELIGAAVLGFFAVFYFFATIITNVETERNRKAASDLDVLGRRENFTLNLVLNMRSDELLNWHRENILAEVPTGQVISHKMVPSIEREHVEHERVAPSGFIPEDVPLYESLIYLLNYYEFIATGIHKGIIDRDLIELTVGSVICKFYEKVEPFVDSRIEASIRKIRQKQTASSGDPSNHIYSDLKKLMEEWREQDMWFVTPEAERRNRHGSDSG